VETSKAHARRVREGFFDRFIRHTGIDIGCGRLTSGQDLIHPDAVAHDADICDATTMGAYGADTFNYVYASHILEHLWDPIEAIHNWFRILRAGGHLVVCVPHRHLYERKRGLPSRWNKDHKRFYTPAALLQEIESALMPRSYSLVYVRDVCDGWIMVPDDVHAQGEYSIECVVRKVMPGHDERQGT